METTITTKLGAIKLLAENMVLTAEAGDLEGAVALAKEVEEVVKVKTDKVRLEDCPMSESGIWVKPEGGDEEQA